MKRLFLLCLAAALAAVACAKRQQAPKPLYMWFDCEANYARLSHPDSIRHYVSRLHDMGFTDLVVDVKSIMGETLYKSDIAPYMGEWEGVTRPEDYDMLGHFIEEGHKRGMRVTARSTSSPEATTTSTGASSTANTPTGSRRFTPRVASCRSAGSRATTTACSTRRTPKCGNTSWPS